MPTGHYALAIAINILNCCVVSTALQQLQCCFPASASLVACRLAALQRTLKPKVTSATLLVFAADHGITKTHPQVSAYPRTVRAAGIPSHVLCEHAFCGSYHCFVCFLAALAAQTVSQLFCALIIAWHQWLTPPGCPKGISAGSSIMPAAGAQTPVYHW